MSEFLLDQKLVDRLVADMEYELDRKAPPENFPKFPDIPSARYTNEDFYDLVLKSEKKNYSIYFRELRQWLEKIKPSQWEIYLKALE